MKIFAEMGALLASRWSGDHAEFAAVAREVLVDCAPAAHVTPDAIVDWAMSNELPLQADLDASFGQPPVTVFAHERFVITALFWVDGTTSIHQHAFSGAFQVLAGSSLHTPFTFERRQELSRRLFVGALRAGTPELLRKGDVRSFSSGPGFVHSLFHLDRPSVTLIARTRHDPGMERQTSYLPPCVEFDPFERDPTLKRRQQLLGMLFALEPDRFRSTAAAFLERCDVESAFHVLRQARKIDHDGTFARLCERARSRHGAVVDALVPAIEEERRRVEIAELRHRVDDPDLRYLLAVLLNATDREAVLKLAHARAPDVSLLEWIRRLAEVRFTVQAGPATFEVSALGIPLDTLALRVLGHMIDPSASDGSPIDRLPIDPSPIDPFPIEAPRVRGAVGDVQGAFSDEDPVKMREAREALLRLRVLAPLFRSR